jgi:uncharacterized membrane protein YjgN (DUF898 family)
MPRNSGRFTFDGGAATYVGTGILAALITICTLGICYPFAVVLKQRWRAKHTYVDGRRLIFTGSAIGLFGHWIKWFLLMLITLGIYGFWVMPRMWKWITENQDFDPAFQPLAQPGQIPMQTTAAIPGYQPTAIPAPASAPAAVAAPPTTGGRHSSAPND